jgi:hypothetical protein
MPPGRRASVRSVESTCQAAAASFSTRVHSVIRTFAMLADDLSVLLTAGPATMPVAEDQAAFRMLVDRVEATF